MNQQPARRSQNGQDAALIWLLVTTLAPYWRTLLLALLLLLATAVLNVAPPYLLQQAIDGPLAAGDRRGVVLLGALYALIVVVLFALQYGQTYALQHAGQRALADLRTRLFGQVMRQDQAFFGRFTVGDLVARLTSDIDTLNALLSSSVVTILSESATLIAIIAVMLLVNWQLALLALAVLPLLAMVTIYFRRRIRRSSSGERSALARTSSFLSERLNGMLIVQLFGHQATSAEEFNHYNQAYRRALLALRHHSALFLSLLEILSACGLALLLYGGGRGVLAGWATLGTLVAFVQYAERAFQPILRLSEQYNAVQIALGAAERVETMLRAEPAIRNPERPRPLPAKPLTVELRQVSFAYLPEHPVLRDLSLTIQPGQSVAVVGATGAGKSSLVALLSRLYDPLQGQVLLGGVDIRQLALTDLRRAILVVPQDPVCLAGTIAQNIRLYRADLSADEVRKWAQLANAHTFIERLPGGYDYEVLPGGTNLSQGQRQLLALARALALNPEGILVLDEATSSVDTATEAQIQEALARLLRGRTSIVIAHRLSTIRNADRIIVMHQGRVVEDGSHQALFRRGGYYARLQRQQLRGSAERPG